MSAGATAPVRHDLHVRAIGTHHTVPSLGYVLYRRIPKLKATFQTLPGAEIGRLRKSGAAIFDVTERPLIAYVTDTLPRVLDTHPELLRVPVLLLECTFVDERKSVANARAGGHIHLDDLLPYAEAFENQAVVLMHFSQIYKPPEIREVLAKRCPPTFLSRLVPFLPDAADWPV